MTTAIPRCGRTQKAVRMAARVQSGFIPGESQRKWWCDACRLDVACGMPNRSTFRERPTAMSGHISR
jgi:hypothetical protein